ncbi:MAG: DUF1326 domain-containing protein [Paracoccaceae bacterium]
MAKKTNGVDWRVTGELALNCNCDVFCPCVVSLGQARPSMGYCQAWLGVRIDEGHYGESDLTGLNIAMLLDIPGRMSEGNWTAALYVDETADDDQYAGLEKIMTGGARGTTGLFTMLVGNYLGGRREPVSYATDAAGVRTVTAGKAIFGQVKPIDGADKTKGVTIENTGYWMGPVVTAGVGLKSKLRDFGRVWNFDGKSAEICSIDWRGP